MSSHNTPKSRKIVKKIVKSVATNQPSGEFTAIIGASGSGKSTLLHIIAGMNVPTSGKVYLDGQDIYAQNNEKLAIFRRRQVGLIYQFHNLIPTLNVTENITLPILMDRRKVNEERLNDLLDYWGCKSEKPICLISFQVVSSSALPSDAL